VKFKRSLREKVAEYAAKILYTGRADEYIEAKKIAAKEMETKIMPRNFEIALKLLEVALESEGEEYWIRVSDMRSEALELMKIISEFNPRLVGSVWRGIVKPNSDIDIEVDCEEPETVMKKLRENNFEIIQVEEVDLPGPLREGSLAKIKTKTRKGYNVEIILKEHSAYLNPSRCDIYGDVKKGLTLSELNKIMREEPTRLFIPS
jgi:predicted nucleotidyltransferase